MTKKKKKKKLKNVQRPPGPRDLLRPHMRRLPTPLAVGTPGLGTPDLEGPFGNLGLWVGRIGVP